MTLKCDAAAELDLETSTSSGASSSNGDLSDQDMDVSELPLTDSGLLALPEGEESQALVAIVRTNNVAPLDTGSSSSATGALSVYRPPINRMTPMTPLSHFRVMPALSTVGQAGMVVAAGVVTSPILPYSGASGIRAITAGNEVAKYTSQMSADSSASDRSGDSVPAIQHEGGLGKDDLQERVYIRESIISLLLKLHSRFVGHDDSYRPPDVDSQPEEDSRIGDGSFWIAKVLDKLCRLDPRVPQSIASTRAALWPVRTSSDASGGGSSPSDHGVKEREKKQKIKERQQRLLQEFAHKQKQFMQQAMAEEMETDPYQDSSSVPGADASSMAAEDASALEEAVVETYDCVICNQASASTSERPMCLVVLLQASSVLAHKRREVTGTLGVQSLSVSDEDKSSLGKVDTLSVEMERRVENLRQYFDEVSWLLSLSIGHEGGVYVHTCGHYLHLDCHKQYLQSLRSQQRQQSLNVERGEYSCPLCRQLANSALPIATQLCGKRPSSGRPPSALVAKDRRVGSEVLALFDQEPPLSLNAGSRLMEAMGRVMEDMTNATYPRFRQVTATPSPASLVLFVQSIARTNLEIELLQRGDCIFGDAGRSSSSSHTTSNSPTPGTSSASWNSPGLELHFSSSPTPGTSGGSGSGGSGGGGGGGGASAATAASASHATPPWSLLPKRSCLLPLLHVLATHTKVLTTRCYTDLWSRIAGLEPDHQESAPSSPSCSSLGRYDKEVPLLVQDVVCLLIQMVLILPLPLERQHFICLVQRLFNLLAVQITAQLTCRLGEKKRKLYKSLTFGDWNLAALMSSVVAFMEDSHLYIEEDEERHGKQQFHTLNVEADVQQPLYKMALHFLRLASLLQHHLFGDALPVSAGASNTDYEEFFELSSYLSISCEPKFDPGVDAHSVIGLWCRDFRLFLARSPHVARGLLLQHVPWRGPRLLTLPHSYDTLFQVNKNIFVYEPLSITFITARTCTFLII